MSAIPWLVDPLLAQAAKELGDPAALNLLGELVAIAPTNLEDPVHGRWEKPRYALAANRIAHEAWSYGLRVRLFDPLTERPNAPELRGISRPNVVIDLDVGAAQRVLILAHYDVVPVPLEQLTRWRSPPHSLTARPDGRLYGRGANDDLGSGVVAGLLAMRRLSEAPLRRNVRLVVCCDEETGGVGGIEAIKARDATLPPGHPDRIIAGDVALIPDGSPHVAAGSSGVLMVDATSERPIPVGPAVEIGLTLVALHEEARKWDSIYPAPSTTDGPPPSPHITGRATVTRFDYESSGTRAVISRLVRAHAETEATNQIPQSVTLHFQGLGEQLVVLRRWLEQQLAPPFRLEIPAQLAMGTAPGTLALSVVGRGFHAGSPHRALNPVPATLRLLNEAVEAAKLDLESTGVVSFGVDVRLPPEMELAVGEARAMGLLREWIARRNLPARLEAPPGRQRGGYALSLQHPLVARLSAILAETLGGGGVYGDFGGTDASSLHGITTPSGEPIPALVFGSMDDGARIHEAEESVDPRRIQGVAEAIRRFVSDP